MGLPIQQEEALVQSRLQEIFGLTHADVQDVVMQGLLARKGVTAHHPRTFGGYSQWAETVRAFRDKTIPLGWTPSDHDNFPLCVHPSAGLVVAVQTGDRDAGLAAGNPSNRAAKGRNTEEAVWANQRQYSLFDTVPALPTLVGEGGRIMWVLLYHSAPEELRFELSLPLNMVGGKIRSWRERLIFPAIRFNHTEIATGGGDGPEFDVPVERRS